MKVLIVGPTPPPFHGVAAFIRDLLGAAPSFPHVQFSHLDTSDRRDATNLGCWEGGNVALGFANLAEMASMLLRIRPDVVYIPISQNVPAFLRDALFIFQARLYGARVVLQLHGGYFREFYETKAPAWFRAIARLALNRARVIAVLSGEFRPIFEGLVPADCIRVVENGVPDAFARMEPDSTQVERESDTLTILYLSTLSASKGIVNLIRATALLRAELLCVRLRVAGEWSELDARDEALALIARENLGANVEFVGTVDGAAKREFLSSGDVFCLPTCYPYEGQPLAILEAMSAGLPVLSTHHGAIGSTVLDGVTGRLLERDCGPKAIAAALTEMCANRGALRAMGAAGRRRYLEKYTVERCHAGIVQAFEAAI